MSETVSEKSSDRSLFVIVTIILGGIALMTLASFFLQYGAARAFATQAVKAGTDPVLEITALKFSEATLLRISTFFLSFILIYVGALYVLRTAQTAYSASVDAPGIKTAFKATSPGLVLATLGVALIMMTTLRQSAVEYRDPITERQVNFAPERAPGADLLLPDEKEQPKTDVKPPPDK